MNYDTLIDHLAADLKPVHRRRVGFDTWAIAVICVVELALFVGLGVARPNILRTMTEPTVWWRLMSLGAITLVAGTAAILSLNPTRAPRRGLRWIAGIVALCLLTGWRLGTGIHGAETIIQRLNWTAGVQCAGKIALLSLPPLIGLWLLMRRGAPTDAGGTALLAGLAAAGWGAFEFVFACPFRDPLYIVVWYGVGVGIVTITARLLLPWLTRW